MSQAAGSGGKSPPVSSVAGAAGAGGPPTPPIATAAGAVGGPGAGGAGGGGAAGGLGAAIGKAGLMIGGIMMLVRLLDGLVNRFILAPVNRAAGALGFGQSIDAGRPGDKHLDLARSAYEKGADITEKFAPGGKLIVPFVRLGQAIAFLPNRIEIWGEGLLKTMEPLRRFNGQLSIAFARLDRQRLIQDREFARGTSGSTSALAGALGGLSKELQPLRRMGTTYTNVGGIIVAHLAKLGLQALRQTEIMKTLETVAKMIEAWLGFGAPGPWQKFLDDVGDGKFSG